MTLAAATPAAVDADAARSLAALSAALADGASYSKFLRALESELPAAPTPDADDASSDDDGDAQDIDALMAADGASATPATRIDALMAATRREAGPEAGPGGDEDDDLSGAEAPSHLDMLMLKDILDKANLDVDMMMLKDLLASDEFRTLLHGPEAPAPADPTPLLDIFSLAQWAALIRAWMSPVAARQARPAVAVDELWSEILAGPRADAGPPPSWFNTVCTWFSREHLPDDVLAPGPGPERAVAAPGAVPVAESASPPRKVARLEEDTVSESSRSVV